MGARSTGVFIGNGGGKASLPGQGGAEDLSLWLRNWARSAQEFCSFGERLEVNLMPFDAPSGVE